MNKEINKSETLGLVLYYASAILLILGLGYILWFSGEMKLLKNVLIGAFGEGLGRIYLAMCMLGIGTTTFILLNIATYLFHPETREERDKEIEILRVKEELRELEKNE